MTSAPPGWVYVQCPRLTCARSLVVPTCTTGRIQCGSCHNIFKIHAENEPTPRSTQQHDGSGVEPFPPIDRDNGRGYTDDTHTLIALRKRYGSWDDAALQDVLRSCNNNVDAAVSVLDEWMQDSHSSSLSLAKLSVSAFKSDAVVEADAPVLQSTISKLKHKNKQKEKAFLVQFVCLCKGVIADPLMPICGHRWVCLTVCMWQSKLSFYPLTRAQIRWNM